MPVVFGVTPKTLKRASLSKKFLECPLSTLGSNLVRLTLVLVENHVLTWAGLGYMDTFSDRSTKVWNSYSNICIFMIVFILSVWTGSDNVAIFLLFQMKTHLKMHLYNQSLYN